jgi:NAD(P)H-dependent flavin oxidoreductase YrpB (nitropropane dioxygenase family)
MKEKILRTKLCDMLGCDYPICLAGMGLGTYLGGKDGRAIVSGSELCAAVSNAGGFGTLACTGLTLDILRDEIKRTKKLTDKPFGVDLMFPATEAGEIIRKMKEELVGGKYKEHTDFVEKLAQKLGVTSKLDWEDILNLTMWDPDFCRAQAEIVFEEGADAFCLGTGSPKWVVDKAHDCGMKVISLIGTVRQAAAVKETGADIIVAQGYDAGGHTGDIGTFSLLPQVIDAVSPTPVLAAGGIFDGRGIAAALSFGAIGVWVGTAFEATVEANISDQQKQNIIVATERALARQGYLPARPCVIHSVS